MGHLTDIVLSVPIGFFYLATVQKISEILTTNLKYEEKIQKILIMSFIGGMFGYMVAMSLFNEGHLLENRPAKYGAVLGGSLLIINAIVFNWSALDNDAKLFIMGFVLVCLLVISYRVKNK